MQHNNYSHHIGWTQNGIKDNGTNGSTILDVSSQLSHNLKNEPLNTKLFALVITISSRWMALHGSHKLYVHSDSPHIQHLELYSKMGRLQQMDQHAHYHYKNQRIGLNAR